MGNFSGQIAVITGASSGIGKAIALGLAAQGAILCLVGRQEKTLKEVAEEAHRATPRVLTYQADLGRDEDMRELITRLQQDCPHLDLLIHSAGVITLGKLDTASVEDFDWQYRINVRAPYVLTQGLLPMLRVRQGQIVFLNSSVGLNARGSVGQYAATKHALRAIADSLREEVNADGVRVLSVFLGRTASPMQQRIHEKEGKTYRPDRLIQPEDVSCMVLKALSLPRSAEVTDIHIRPMQKP